MPVAPISSIEPGQFVRHPGRPDWGLGQVQSALGDRVTVNFENAGKVMVNVAVVSLELCEEPRPRPDRPPLKNWPKSRTSLSMQKASASMIDPFGRAVTYLRVSVTDRCDLRCVYCMSEDMTFLPKTEILSLEELDRLCGAFIRLGTTKIRITGGEPLVRRDVIRLFGSLGARLGSGLKELTVTTNGTQLAKHAEALRRRRASRERFARYSRSRPVRGDHAPGKDREDARGRVRGQGGWARGEDQRGRAARRERGRVRRDGRVVRRAWLRSLPHRDNAARRHRRGPDRQYLPLSLVRSRLKRHWTLGTRTIARAARPVT